MAISHEIQVPSHDSIYTEKPFEELGFNRNLTVYFSVPQNGINEDTGLLLLIAGYGAQATSNVYQQMRNEFADEYNLVTIQCDYFGYEFMQSWDKVILPTIDKKQLEKIFSSREMKKIYDSGKFDFDAFLKVGSKYNITIHVGADLSSENNDNFNDMGLLQAIDNIVALFNVMNILYENDYSFNSKKIIVYGHSHGAYLSYLCNAFAPKLFSLIIDNSAWLYPVYMYDNRLVNGKLGELTVVKIFEYLAKELVGDKEILSLSFLYSMFENRCKIISYHGTTDNLISCQEKHDFCSKIKNCMFNEISPNEVDNEIFKSTDHGLDADFKKMFHSVMKNNDITFEKANYFDIDNEIIYKTAKYKYLFDYQNIVPKINIKNG